MSARTETLDHHQPPNESFWRALWRVTLELGIAIVSAIIFWTTFTIEWFSGRSTITDMVLAGSILLTAVLAMNGLAKLELVLHPINDRILAPYLTRPGLKYLARPAQKVLHFIHEVADEAELAGIAVGVCMALPALSSRGVLVHMSGSEWHHLGAMAATLLGIMSMANLLVHHMTPMLGLIEKLSMRLLGPKLGAVIGLRLALGLGALLSSFTGEPAAAVFKLSYFKHRVKPGREADAAVGFAMTIGSGGGLTFFAAPPILIIWASYLSAQLNWTLADLFTLVGIGCIAYVIVSAHALSKYLELPSDLENIPTPSARNLMGLIPMIAIIIPHVVFYKHLPLWVMLGDVIVGIVATRVAARQFADASHEDRFAAMWQPWILAGLLIMLEFIGLVGDPLIMAMGEAIPQGLPLPIIGLLLFQLTATVSHFADNALASRVFIMIPISLIPALGMDAANFLAVAVVTGALFGSLLTVSANLPNFYIKRVLDVDPGTWFKSGLKHYWTVIVYVIWLVAAWQYLN